MPIKCAGAPQKTMYLSCDPWCRQGRLAEIEVSFCNAGEVLFGVAGYVPVPLPAAYLGYGSRLLTVERGRIVLAEFGYAGVLQPSFPALGQRRHPGDPPGLVAQN